MIDLRDSSHVLDDAGALAARVREDGYVFVRGLFEPATVHALRDDILATIDAHGWLAPGSDRRDARPGSERRVEGDPGYWDGYHAVQSLESVHRFAHDARALSLLHTLLGEPVLVHPRNFVRIMWPDPAVTTPPHQDFTHVGGSVDVFTCWTPLGDCPRELGGLRVLRGSQNEGVRALVPATGAGGVRAEGVDDDDPRWATTDYEAGDALLFHCMTVHAGVPNSSSDRLRLSIDNRYQALASPLTTWSARPHFYRTYPDFDLDWDEFTEGWETTRWVEVPEGVELVDAAPMAPPAISLGTSSPRSRFVDTGDLEAALAVGR